MKRPRSARSRAKSIVPGKGTGAGGRGLRELQVHPREAGLRLDLFLVEALAGLSRKRAKRLVDARRVWVEGKIEPMASRVLRGGENVQVDLAERKPPDVVEVRLLYEDDFCVGLDKPPGIPSGPTRDPQRIHAARLAEGLVGRPLTLLHRLDKDTSGVLLLGKSEAFSRAVLEAFRRREIDKVYLALVRGRPAGAFEMTSHLREGEGDRIVTVRSGGMRAETRFRTLIAEGDHALVEARPRTGRTHQIRVHLAQAGHPILGDALYGGEATVAGHRVPRQMLHAVRLTFHHAAFEREVALVSPVPEDFLVAARLALGPTAGRQLSREPVR